MFLPENFNQLFKEVMAHLGGQCEEQNICRRDNGNNHNNQNSQSSQGSQSNQNNQCAGSNIAITPSQALVIAGILGGVLNVESVLVDKQQTVEILLTGSLKRKTELEKMFDKVGTMPFDTVLNALLGRLT